MTEAQLIEAARKGAVSLPTSGVQATFPSGKHMKDWATENGLKLTVHKGSVAISSTGKPMNKTTVAEEVQKVAERVKKRL